MHGKTGAERGDPRTGDGSSAQLVIAQQYDGFGAIRHRGRAAILLRQLDRRNSLMATRRERSIWKGMVAGAAGGIAGSWAMNCFQSYAWRFDSSRPRVEGRHRFDRLQASDPQETQRGDATVEAAEQISRRTLGRSLDREEREVAGPAVHYAFGAVSGALYGALREFSPKMAAGFGTPFGASVWLGGVELGVPALGLSRRPSAYPASMHAISFGAHIVFGLTAEAVRRTVRRALR
jgi:putative membrane protein